MRKRLELFADIKQDKGLGKVTGPESRLEVYLAAD